MGRCFVPLDLRRCLWRRWCSGRRLILLWGRAALCARGRRPAREPSAPRASLGASSRSPARPRHRPRAPQPGPSCALRSLRRPPHRRRLRCWVVMRRLEAQPGPATALGHRSQALLRPPDPPAPSTPVVRLECVVKLVACGSAGVPGTVGSGRPRDRHTRASLGVVDLEARPCPPDPPAPSTPAAPAVLGGDAPSRSPARPRHRPRAP